MSKHLPVWYGKMKGKGVLLPNIPDKNICNYIEASSMIREYNSRMVLTFCKILLERKYIIMHNEGFSLNFLQHFAGEKIHYYAQ